MKTLFTLFVLLFSSSVVASDNLSGKKIVCFKPMSSNDTVYLIGFDFKNLSEVSVYTETNNDPLVITNMYYKTSTSKIEIKWLNNTWFYKISRKTLGVENNYGIDYQSDQCSLVSETIKGVFLKHLKKYKKGNLI